MSPNETQKIGLGVRFLIPEGHCALLMNKSSALPKYKVKNNHCSMSVITAARKNTAVKRTMARAMQISREVRLDGAGL
jgi:hypothetical protein